MALKQEDLFKLDLYELLGLETSCTTQDVKKAFRKKALKCHPDKNPDDPNAAQLFHQLSCALEILTDSSARAAYDKVLNGRKAAKIRNQQLDSRIKKLKEDLEERERNAANASSSFVNDEKKLQAEVERLRKEGSRLLQEEISRIQVEVNSNLHSREETNKSFVLTVRWKAEKSDSENGGYNYTVLHNLLSKYGDILTLLVSPKRKGRAVVEFRTWEAVERAAQLETGLPSNPLMFERVGGKRPTECSPGATESPKEQNQPRRNVFPFANRPQTESKADHVNFPSWSSGMNSSRLNDDELEKAVLERLHQREKMKRSAEGESAT